MSDAATPPIAAPPTPSPPPPADARARDTRKTPQRPCLNCGDATVGNYCPTCGQRKVEVRISLRRMLMEALDDQFSLNSALPRTLGALFFRPGHLTREHVGGRIARYIPPFRLYLVSSLIFFLALSVVGSDERMRFSLTSDERAARDGNGRPAAAAPAAEPEQAGGEERVDAWIDEAARDVDTGIPALDRLARERLRRFEGMSLEQAGRQMLSTFLERTPTMLFVLLPIFAAVIKLLYLRQKRYYVEHFIFALHLHAFAFLTMTVSLLLPVKAVSAAMSLWMTVYIYAAMKRFYGQGWLLTGAKYAVLGVTYVTILTTAIFVTLMATFLFA